MNISKFTSRIREANKKIGQTVGATFYAPSAKQGQVMLFLLGIGLLTGGLVLGADAQGHAATYNDVRVANSVNAILTYLEGSFGALIMVSAGIGAIMSAAFGQYRAALGLLVVAIGAFILRSLMSTFFNDANIQQ